jgi:hypothetical protein
MEYVYTTVQMVRIVNRKKEVVLMARIWLGTEFDRIIDLI